MHIECVPGSKRCVFVCVCMCMCMHMAELTGALTSVCGK